MLNASTISRSVFWRVVETGGSEVVALLSFVVMARILAPDAFGAVAIATAVVLVMQVLLFSGLPDAMIQKPELDRRTIDTALTSSLALSAMLVLLAGIIAWPLSVALARPDFPKVFLALAPTLLFNAVSMPLHALLRRQMNYRAIALRTLVANGGSVVVGIGLGLAGAGFWALVAIQWVQVLLGMILLIYFTGERPWRLSWQGDAFQSLLPVARPVMVGGFCSEVGRRLDLVVVAYFADNHQVGLYFLITRLLQAVRAVTQHSSSELGLVMFSRLQADPAMFQTGLRRAWRLATFGCLLGFGALAAVSPGVVPLVFGQDWVEAVPPLQVFALFATASALTMTLASILVAAGHASLASRLSIVTALILVLVAAVAARFGLVPLALAMGTAQVLLLVPFLMAINARVAPMSGRLLLDVLPLLLAFAGLAWIGAMHPPVYGSLIEAAVALLVFVLGMGVVGAFVLSEEIQMFARRGAVARR